MPYLSKLAKRLAVAARFSAGVVLLAIACTTPEEREFLGPNPGPSVVTSLTISPKIGTIRPGEEVRFTATGRTNSGNTVPVQVDWSASGGTIAPDGLFTADQLGHFSIAAKLHDNPSIKDSAQISVFIQPSDVVKLTVTPNDVEVTVSEGIQLEAFAELANGTIVRQPPLTWSAAAGQVDGSGYFVAPDVEGTFSVHAAVSSGVSGKADVKVRGSNRTLSTVVVSPASVSLMPGQTQQFTAVGRYLDGGEAPISVLWSSTGGSINGNGTFTAGSTAGTYRVIARYKKGTQADTSFVTVTAPEIIGLDLSPDGSALTTGASLQYVATARMSDGSTKSVGASWRATGGTISSAGLYTAPAIEGEFKVIGTVAGADVADTAAVMVSAPAVSLTGLQLNPSSANVPAGATRQFSVTGTWSDGSNQVPPVTWTATGGSVSSGGLYQAGVIPGTYRVIASSATWGRADTATVVVGGAELNSLTLSPETASLYPGQTRQFAASGSWSDGTSSAPPVAWTGEGGTISTAGLYTAGSAAGTFEVIALHSSGLADTSLVTIAPPPPVLLSLSLTPASANVAPGGSIQFSVSGTWTEGGSGPPPVTYSATGGTISATGLYTAGSTAGTYRVIALHTGGTKADTSSVVVSVAAPTLTSISVSPASTSLQTGGGRQFTVSALWSDGSTTSPAVVWSTNGGSVTTSGMYTAPSTVGAYRVVATQMGGTKADTAAVTVTAAASVVSLQITPEQKTLAPGQGQQYTAQATYSNGGTGTPSLSWAATGGSMTSGGLYTAGSTIGSYRVIANCSGCTVTDTSAVTIQSTSPSGTTMTISPETLTLDIGEVYRFTATARLSDGTTQTAPSVTWTTSNGEINASGWYRAPRTAGTYTVTVRYTDGATDQATVSVRVPTAPYFSDNFDSCTLNKTANAQGFLWRDTGGGNSTEVPTVTNAMKRSGNCSLRFTFAGGAAGDDAWSEQRFAMGKKLTEVYIQWYQYWPTGSESPSSGPKFLHRNDTGPDNNKFLRFWDEDYSQYKVKMGFSTLPTSTGDSYLITEYGHNGGGVGQFGSDTDPAGISSTRRGRWVKITAHVRLATAADNDGVIELWVDGVKTISNTTLPMYPTSGIGNYLRNGYLMGWANSGFNSTSSTFIDDLVISGVPIT